MTSPLILPRRHLLIGIAFAILSYPLAPAGVAQAQAQASTPAWPTKAVRLIAAFPPGTSIAFWDNQGTAHAPPFDIFDLTYDRQLFRTTLVGSVPVGVDGRPSSAISGDPMLAHHAAAY